MAYREPETSLELDVDGLSIELPGGLVSSATLVDIATNGSLWNRNNAKVSCKARQ